MYINRRVVMVGLLTIFLIWTANILYFQTQQLSEPLVMKHYYEVDLRETVSFDIYYLVNKNENIYVVEGRLPEGLSVTIDTFNHGGNSYTHHVLKIARVAIYESDIEELLEDGKYQFNQLKLYFSNGVIKDTDIGEIIIYKEKNEIAEDKPLQFISGGSSSDNVGFTLLSTEKPVILYDFNYRWEEELQDFLHVNVNTSQEMLDDLDGLQRRNETIYEKMTEEEVEDYIENNRRLQDGLFSMEGEKISRDLFPINLQAGEYIKINHVFNIDKNDNKYRNYYSINTRFEGETLDNREFQVSSYVDYRPHFSNSDIRQIIREKRGK